jgi:hypothetical protein
MFISITTVTKQVQSTTFDRVRRDKLVAMLSRANVSNWRRETNKCLCSVFAYVKSCMYVTLYVHPTASDQARRDTSVAMVFGGSIINPIKGDEKVPLPNPLIWVNIVYIMHDCGETYTTNRT